MKVEPKSPSLAPIPPLSPDGHRQQNAINTLPRSSSQTGFVHYLRFKKLVCKIKLSYFEAL